MNNLQINLENLKQEYLEGKSCSYLAKKYNKCPGTISKYLKQSGIIIINHQNKTKFNENINIEVLRERYADEHAYGVVGWFEFDSKVIDEQQIAKLTMASA